MNPLHRRIVQAMVRPTGARAEEPRVHTIAAYKRSRRTFLSWLPAGALFALGNRARAADEDAFRYRGRDFSPTGSHVIRKLTWSSKIPFDKTFAELTPTQVAHIRDQYDGLKPDEEPPFPQGGLGDVFRQVDDAVDQRTPRLEPGPLVVVASIDAEGDVQSLKFYKTPNAFAMGAVGQALLRTHFKPATRNGKPVSMDFLLSAELL